GVLHVWSGFAQFIRTFFCIGTVGRAELGFDHDHQLVLPQQDEIGLGTSDCLLRNLVRAGFERVPQGTFMGCPEDSQPRLRARTRTNLSHRWRKALVALEESEEVPSNSVFRMLVP